MKNEWQKDSFKHIEKCILQSWRDEFLKEICGFANAQGDRVNDRVSDRVNFANEILLLVEKNPVIAKGSVPIGEK